MTTKALLCSAAAGVISIAFSSAALAQAPQTDAAASPAEEADAQLGEIVVTAQKRSENIQKVPVTVTAFNNQALETRGITNLLEIQNLTPGLLFGEQNGTVQPFLRGVGNRSDSIGNESSVPIYVDGVYFTRIPSGIFSLTSVDRVEVLKGPQGTLFGRNSSAGLVHVITRDPSHDTQVFGHLGYGNYDTFKADFYGTTGLTDTVAIDVSLSGRNQGNGFGTNVTTGNRTSYEDNFVTRSKLMFEPSDTTRFMLSGFYAYSQTHMGGNTFPGTVQGYSSLPNDLPQPQIGFYDQQPEIDSLAKTDVWGVSFKAEQEIGFAKFSSITAYMYTKAYQRVDNDYTPRPDRGAELFGEIKQFTQEFQLASVPQSKLSWIVGLFYYNTLGQYKPLRFQGPGFFPGDVIGDNLRNFLDIYGRQRAKSYAAYGQATYEVLPSLKVTGGIRYTRDKITGRGFERTTMDNVVVFEGDLFGGTGPGGIRRGSDSVEKVTYRGAIDYELTPDVLIFGSISRGYKSANFNLLPFNAVPTKPEVTDAYEIGVKTQLFDRRLRLNAAIFQYDIKNPQVQLLNGGSITLSNAGASRVRGAEFEGALAATRELTFNFGLTYVDAKYTKYGEIVNGQCIGCAPSGPQNPLPPFGTLPTDVNAIVADGKRTPYSPELTANVGAQYVLETDTGKWTATADYSYNDGYFFEPDNFLKQGSYHIVNAQLQYEPNEHFSFAVWGKNLADEKIATAASTQAGPTGYPFIAGAPRTYGVTAGFKF